MFAFTWLVRAPLAAWMGLALAVGAVAVPPSPAPLWVFPAANGRPAQFGMVHDGQLYCSSYNGHVYQLDLATGTPRHDWSITPGWAPAYSAPLMVDGELFVYVGNKCFYRLDKHPVTQAVKLADFSHESHSIRVEALAYDPGTGLFFLQSGQSLHAVDRTGAVHWSLPYANRDWGEPMSSDGMLYAFDTTSRWIHKHDPANPAVALWSVPFNAYSVYLSKGMDGDGDMLIFAVAWENTTAPVGRLAAIHDAGPLAGTKKWEVELAHAIKHASLWEGRDILVIPAMNERVEFRRASTGEFLRDTRLSAGVDAVAQSPWSQVVISGDYGVVTTHDDYPVAPQSNFVFVLDLNTGAELWRSDPMHGGVGCMLPILSQGIAVVGTYDGSAAWHAYALGEGEAVPFSRFGNARNTGGVPGGLTTLTGRVARTYYVATNGMDGANDGLSWATACASISNAVARATHGDTVIVSNGVYALTAPVRLDQRITVRSAHGPDVTVVDGQDSVRGFIVDYGATLEGFTITRGLADVVPAVHASRSLGGGALLVAGTIRDCILRDNQAQDGGGIYFMGSASLVSNCVIQGNAATGFGGGLANYHHGGGVASHCTIVGNTGNAGGARLHQAMLQNSVIASNACVANYAGGIRQVGGVTRNCLVVNNTAAQATGGGLYVSDNGLVENVTVVGNHAGSTGTDALIRSSGLRANNSGDTSLVRNVIVWGNTFMAGGQETRLAAASQIRYSCQTNYAGSGNIAADPLFANAAAHDYSLRPWSPCVNAGENRPWMDGAQDLAGNPRITPVGVAVVDMGALEYAAGLLAVEVAVAHATGPEPVEIIFDARASGNTNGIYYRWSFRDGGATLDLEGAGLSLVTNAYPHGAYTAALVVSNAAGETVAWSQPVISAPGADVAYVAAGGLNVWPFETWENAAHTIAEAVAAAGTGATVLVADGVYTQAAHVAVTKGITVRSVNGPERTIVDGAGRTRGFLINHADAVLDGFTIRNGLGTAEPDLGVERAVGGGVLLTAGHVRHCHVIDNRAQDGGGIYLMGSASVVSHCVVMGNQCTDNGFGGGLANGGVGVGHTGGWVTHCTVVSNTARAGGMWVRDALVENCRVGYNQDPANFAGGIRQEGGTNRNSLIFRNTAAQATAGGIYISENGVLENATIVGNVSGSSGPDAINRSSALRASNSGDASVIRNTIVWSNTVMSGAQEVRLADSAHLSFSCQPLIVGNGNLTQDPVFQSPLADDFRLRPVSPCRNAGANQPWMSAALAEDLAGGPRLVGERVDIGAYEHPPIPTTGLILFIH